MQLWTAAMRAGRYDAAWALCEQVLERADPATRDDPSLPYHRRWVWDGTPLDGRDVLVRCYHGLGDTLQFARFLPALGARAASVTLEAQPCLLPLLAQVAGVDRLVPFDPARPSPPAECDVEIMELAFALRRPPTHAQAGYLSADRAPLVPGTIALCYGASEWQPSRRIPPALLARLCADHRCISLVPEPTDLAVLNPTGCSQDVAETASLIAGAALVITVDTMVAHLAGALGRPTWLLLKSDPDWRWPVDWRTSDWYPSFRLYHQPYPGGWEPVVDEVAGDLARWRNSDQALVERHEAQPVAA